MQGTWPTTPRGWARAREAGAAISEQVRTDRLVGVPRKPERPARLSSADASETLSRWFVRWIEARRARGLESVRDDESRFKTHIEPVLGHHPVRALQRLHVEQLVEQLDGKIRDEQIAWKTARNVWAVLTKMGKDMSRSKRLGLRVREDDPCAGVEGPDQGGDRAKVFLYPSEVAQFLSCTSPGVTLEWRRLVALAVYLGVRAGELEALEWSDFDLDHGKATIHRAVSRDDRGTVKSTKSETPRVFSVEPALLPLLRSMHAEAQGKGRLVKMPRHRDLAEGLRDQLQKAGVKRAELYVSDRTRLNLRFHDLRATHVTWSAVRGDNPARIMARVGHEDWATLKKYLRQAEALQDGFGDVFGPLPEALGLDDLAPQKTEPTQDDSSASNRPKRAKCSESLRGGRDLNPRPPA
jgi:integrase